MNELYFSTKNKCIILTAVELLFARECRTWDEIYAKIPNPL